MTSERNDPPPGNPIVPGAPRVSPRDDSMVPSRVIAVQDGEPAGTAPATPPREPGARPRHVAPPPRAIGSAVSLGAAAPSTPSPPRPKAPPKSPLSESFALPQRVVEAEPSGAPPITDKVPGPASSQYAPSSAAPSLQPQPHPPAMARVAPAPSTPAHPNAAGPPELGEDTAPDDLPSAYSSPQQGPAPSAGRADGYVAVRGAVGEAQPPAVQVVPPRAPPAPHRAAPPQPTVAIADSAEASDPDLAGLAGSSADPFDDWLDPAPVGGEPAAPSSSSRHGRVITQRPRRGGLRRPRGRGQTWLIRSVYLASLLAIGFVGVQSTRGWLKKREQKQQALQALPPVRPTGDEANMAAQALRPQPSEAPRVARGSVDSEPSDEWQRTPIAAHAEGLEEATDEPYEQLEVGKGSARRTAARSALPVDPAARVPRNQAKRLGASDYERGAERRSAADLVEQASQKVVDGDLRGALRIYEELARRWPEEPSHAAMVRALRTKLERP